MSQAAKQSGAGGTVLTARKAFLSRIAGIGAPEDIAGRLYQDRAFDLATLLRVMSCSGLLTVLLLAICFRQAPDRNFLRLLFLAASANYAGIFFKSDRWIRGGRRFGNPVAFVRELFTLQLCLGCIWAMILIAAMRVANAAQSELVFAMIVAGMSTTVLVAPLSSALASWVPVTLGAAVALLTGDQPVNPYGLICLTGYAGLTGFASIYLNKRLTERTISGIRVEENAEVIKLLLRDFEESASDWLWETDAKLQMQHVSARLVQVAGKTQKELEGRFPQVLFGELPIRDQWGGSPLAKLNRCISERLPFRDVVVQVIVRGEERSWQLTGKPIVDKSGAFIGYHGVGSDVTSARRSQEQISFLAHHDSLTKLPNRVLFNEMLHQGCTACDDRGLALLCLDLDDFKSVNDTLGHATGDALLIAVAERIRGCIREGDVAARLAGDEFAILVSTRNADEVDALARRIIERTSRPYHFDGRLVEIGASIGVTMAPKDGQTPGELLKNADLALYRAKADGRATWRFYDLQMDERVNDQRQLQTDLRQALARDEFYLDFQPIIDLKTQRIVAAEALLRWCHAERGQLSPAEFIPMAESAALIAPIGAWVLRQACAVAAKWPEDVRVAVNLSPLQFRDERLIRDVDDALRESGLAASRLELEITETALLETNKLTLEALTALHERGIGIALDDFGTGYSGLGYLRRFPFDKIKIDASFIRDLGQENHDPTIILAMIGLAANMKLAVIAEGVETEQQANFLIENGCSQAQGFLFHRPLSADRIGSLIADRPSGLAAAVRSAAE